MRLLGRCISAVVRPQPVSVSIARLAVAVPSPMR
jgi:hypothetical protein